MSIAPFPIDPVLTGIAIAYQNQDYIADRVLPRVNPVLTRQTFNYKVWTKAEQFTVPNTAVGRRGAPAELEFTATETPATTLDYGLDDPLPQADIDQASSQGIDLTAFSTQSLTNLIMLDREIRVAGIVFSAGNYASGQSESLSGSQQWSDYADSDPIGDITAALDTPLIRPNTMVIGRAAFTKLSQHPKIVKAVHGNAGDAGIASAAQIAALFELKDVLIGAGMKNTANRGQTASYGRIWGKSCALLYLDSLYAQGGASTNVPSYGGTFQYGTRIAGAQPDGRISVRGGQRVRVAESVKEVVVANDLGFFIDTVVA